MTNPDLRNYRYNNVPHAQRPLPSQVNPVPPALRNHLATIAQTADLLNVTHYKVRRMIANGYIRVDSRIYHYNRFIKLLTLEDVHAVAALLQANPNYVFTKRREPPRTHATPSPGTESTT